MDDIPVKVRVGIPLDSNFIGEARLSVGLEVLDANDANVEKRLLYRENNAFNTVVGVVPENYIVVTSKTQSLCRLYPCSSTKPTRVAIPLSKAQAILKEREPELGGEGAALIRLASVLKSLISKAKAPSANTVVGVVSSLITMLLLAHSNPSLYNKRDKMISVIGSKLDSLRFTQVDFILMPQLLLSALFKKIAGLDYREDLTLLRNLEKLGAYGILYSRRHSVKNLLGDRDRYKVLASVVLGYLDRGEAVDPRELTRKLVVGGRVDDSLAVMLLLLGLAGAIPADRLDELGRALSEYGATKHLKLLGRTLEVLVSVTSGRAGEKISHKINSLVRELEGLHIRDGVENLLVAYAYDYLVTNGNPLGEALIR